MSPINDRAQHLLKVLVETYIEDGQPVGSKKLVDQRSLSVSSATARNIMADLEEHGYIKSPHRSAGRIPTSMGYRFFVDSLINVQPLKSEDVERLGRTMNPDMSSHELVESASGLLSEVTKMAGVVTLPKRDQTTLKHVDFLPLSSKRVLVILVLDEHEVQNRIIYTQNEYTEGQLKEAANYINHLYTGESLKGIREKIIKSMRHDKDHMDSLMQTALEMSSKGFEREEKSDYVVAGQENLFQLVQSQALANLKELFEAFSLKGDILHLLDHCMESEGIQLFIGDESGYKAFDECSVITAPYQVDGELVGVLGIIGPSRMPYERVIPVVDATAKILSTTLDASIK